MLFLHSIFDMIVLELIMKTIIFFSFLIFSFFGCINENFLVITRVFDKGLSLSEKRNDVLKKIDMPLEYRLEVPFVMQAPFANWSLHNESCEEAGILLAHYYYLNQSLSLEKANQELLDMVSYQQQYYGGEFDIYADGMGQLASDYYGYNNYHVFEGTIAKIKNELLKNNPVIVPTTAAYLKTEKSDYPEMGYHVVVVVGYNERGFVTHDPGTYTGAYFTYTYSSLQNAMRDYNSQVLVLK